MGRCYRRKGDMKENKRIEWLDVAKCFGIFAVWLGHMGTAAGWSCPFVFKFQVPLFFLLAGCTEYLSKETNIWNSIKKKVNRILWPYIFFGILSMVIQTIQTDASLGDVKEWIVLFLKGATRNTFFAAPLWFFTCLLVIEIVFEFIKRIKYKSCILLICGVLYVIAVKVLAPPRSPYNVDSAAYYCIYYAIGYVTFPYVNKLLTDKDKKSKALLVISGVLTGIYSAFIFFQIDIFDFLRKVPYIKIFRPVLMGLLISWFFLVLSYLCRNIEIFHKIGKNTLYLCGSEHIVKACVPRFLEMIGLSISISNPLAVYMYVAIILVLTNMWLVPMEKRIMITQRIK